MYFKNKFVLFVQTEIATVTAVLLDWTRVLRITMNAVTDVVAALPAPYIVRLPETASVSIH